MLTYDYDSRNRTLAGLSVDAPLPAAAALSLQLTRVETEVEQRPDGQIETFEVWDNGLGLIVDLVDGLVFLVKTERVRVDGREATDWTQQDFVQHLGPISESEVLVEDLDLHAVRWLKYRVWITFHEGVLQEFCLRGVDEAASEEIA